MKCTNPECPAKIKKRIVNFVGRDAMDIKGFGPEYIGTLCDLGYIRDISDIYRLKDKRDELVEKGLIGKEKNTDKLLKVIEDSKSNDPERLLSGLAIENVGKNTARTIMRHFKSFDLLMNAGKEELTAVDDVGEITAASVYDFFRNEGIIRLIKDLKDFGLKMEVSSGEEQSDIFAGRTYVITGDLTHFKNRDELIAYIENRGGKVAGSVSKKTWALINNDAASASGKNKKAKALGINIITEEELLSEEKDL